MTRDEFVMGFDRLQAAFEHPVKDATADLYYDVLRGYNADDWQAVVREAIAEEDRWPRVGVLLRRLRDLAVDRREREQQAKAEAARWRVTGSTPTSLRTGLEEFTSLRTLLEISRQRRAGEITAEEFERRRRAWWVAELAPVYTCATCQDSGVLHWDELAPPDHPFAGTRYATAGRCRCSAGRAWDLPFAPAALQPAATP